MIKQIIAEHINEQLTDYSSISMERKHLLEQLAVVIANTLKAQQQCPIIVICTHNSRRSQLGQVMFQLAAEHFSVEGIRAFSGGTEVTAFNPRMVAAIQRFGFDVTKQENGDNPIYSIHWGSNGIENMQSRTYFDPYNPSAGFVALMVCGSAEKNCPIVSGALHRFGLTFEDPKNYDDTERESAAYDEKIIEMGREIFYILHQVSMNR